MALIEMEGHMRATSYTRTADSGGTTAPDVIFTMDVELLDEDGRIIELLDADGKTVERQPVGLGGVHVDDDGRVWLENIEKEDFILGRKCTPPKELIFRDDEGGEWARVPLDQDKGPSRRLKGASFVMHPGAIELCVADKDSDKEEYARWRRIDDLHTLKRLGGL